MLSILDDFPDKVPSGGAAGLRGLQVAGPRGGRSGTDAFVLNIRSFSGTRGVSIIEVGLIGLALEELDSFSLPVLILKLLKKLLCVVAAVIGDLLSFDTVVGRAVLILSEENLVDRAGVFSSFLGAARSLSIVNSMHPVNVWYGMLSILDGFADIVSRLIFEPLVCV